MPFFKLLLIGAELAHAAAHTLVLCGCKILHPNPLFQKLYFTSDLLTVLATHYLYQTNPYLVTFHFTIHAGAVLHLLEQDHDKGFFHRVFELAAQKWSQQSWLMRTAYAVVTSEDILIHLIGAWEGLKTSV